MGDGFSVSFSALHHCGAGMSGQHDTDTSVCLCKDCGMAYDHVNDRWVWPQQLRGRTDLAERVKRHEDEKEQNRKELQAKVASMVDDVNRLTEANGRLNVQTANLHERMRSLMNDHGRTRKALSDAIELLFAQSKAGQVSHNTASVIGILQRGLDVSSEGTPR